VCDEPCYPQPLSSVYIRTNPSRVDIIKRDASRFQTVGIRPKKGIMDNVLKA
jgi:hypothetical protein